jgi:hypothetical protein
MFFPFFTASEMLRSGMKRRAFFGLFTAAPAALALPAVAQEVPFVRPDPVETNHALRVLAEHPMPAGLSAEARARHREHVVRSALAHLHNEQVRYIASL